MSVKRGILAAVVVAGLTAPAATAVAASGSAKSVALGRTVGTTRQLATANAAADGKIARQLVHAAAEVGSGSNRGTSGAATLVASTPTITSPVQGSTVSGTITLSASSTAPQVHFAIGSHPWAIDVPVVDGVASTTFGTFGYAGPQHFTAADCDASGCSSSAAGVDVTVDNGPATITQPTDQAVVGTSFNVIADAPGGGVRFMLAGQPAGEVAGAPYSTTISTNAVAPGQHTLTAVVCNLPELAVCDTAKTTSVTVDVQNTLAPEVTSASPSLFSPNHDGRRDTTDVAYRLDTEQTVAWSVLNANGKTVRGPVTIGSQAAGPHSFTFDGKNNSGSFLGDGSYTVRLDTTKDVGGTLVNGSAERGIQVDVTTPDARVQATPSTFYPVKDGYLDRATIKASLSEGVESMRVALVDARGKAVRTLDLGAKGRGTHKLTWDGRTRSGALVAPGRYDVQISLRDAAGNAVKIGGEGLTVSGKKLVKKTATKTMAPKSNLAGHLIGACSEIGYPAKKSWPGSLVYLSNYDACSSPSDEDLLAVTRHSLTLPRALKYGTVRVDTYGERTVAGYADRGVVLYEKPSGDITSKGALLRSNAGWHQGDVVDAATFVNDQHVFRWWAGTTNGNFYSIKSFRVTFSYFVLV